MCTLQVQTFVKEYFQARQGFQQCMPRDPDTKHTFFLSKKRYTISIKKCLEALEETTYI